MKPYYSHAGIEIYHGDCLEVLPELGGFDFVFSSPPYTDQRVYSGGFPREKDDWLEWLGRVLTLCYQSSGSVVLNIGDRKRNHVREWDSADFSDYARGLAIPLWERFVWLKYPYLPNGSAEAPDDPIEFCLWFGHPTFRTNNVRRPDSPATLTRYKTLPALRHESNGVRRRQSTKTAHDSGSRPVTVLAIPPVSQEEFLAHPAQCPVDLAAWFIRAGSDFGQTIMDPFCGVGTTLEAAKSLNRRAIGIEIEEKYCAIAAKRLSQEVFDFAEVQP